MTAFNRQDSIKEAIAIKQRRAKIQAKQGHPDMKLNHAGEVRDAQKGDYTLLLKRVKEACEKKQNRNATFVRKLHEH